MSENMQRKVNRLVHEKSPYLLQHANNPVDWYPWCDEAFMKAKDEDKPIFLSIGYSSCHWCHQMNKESFKDLEISEYLNKHFISIKVDREERPDVDQIYMSACQVLTGRGGWPLSIFMTHNQKPFYAGTYFPKESKFNLIGFSDLLKNIINLWEQDRNKILKNSDLITEAVEEKTKNKESSKLNDEVINNALDLYVKYYDQKFGGFGREPKFPTPHNLSFLLRQYKNTKDKLLLDMVENTLVSMYRGGIYDHIGYGFSRYSTDNKWLVPHFEKMLYDNALLAISYLEAFHVTKKKNYAFIAQEIFTYVLRDMTGSKGGFYSAEDADSEGVEGKFYVWTPEEIKVVLGEDEGIHVCEMMDITEFGNFEGKSIPNLINNSYKPIDDKNNKILKEEHRKKLFDFRDKRIHPHKDDKILTSWNGLMIASFACGGRVLNISEYTLTAERAVNFIFDNLITQDGRLLARFRENDAAFKGIVDDYAFLIWGLIELYQSTFNVDYLEKAIKFNDDLVELFWDKENGGLFLYGEDSEKLIVRPKEAYDGAIPSGNSVSAVNFIRLARISGRDDLLEKANLIFELFGEEIKGYPMGYSYMLIGYLMIRNASTEIVIVGDEKDITTRKMIRTIYEEFSPFTSVVVKNDNNKEKLTNLIPFTKNYEQVDNQTTVYICENYACKSPITNLDDLKQILKD